MLFLGLTTVVAQDNVDATQETIEVQEVIEPIVINWESSYKEAINRAKKENKPLLIYFTGSDWCGPCKVLNKKLFNTEKFQEYAESKIVLYKANFPRNKNLVDADTKQQNEKLQIRYGQRKFPTMIIVDGKENVIDSKQGMYMTEYYYPFFDKAIKGL